jgi:hypothetical protein
MKCTARKEVRYDLEIITLENDLIRAVILGGKGADLIEFVWKPLNINCLLRGDTRLEDFEGLNLHKQRLKSHRDHSLGGWMDVLPHLGEYKDVKIAEENGGVATTLPWKCEVINEKDQAGVKCTVDMPLLPLHVEKCFSITEDSGKLLINEKLFMGGDAPARFTWVQHAMFNGDFVNEETVITLPAEKVFNAWEHARNPLEDPDKFVYPVDAIVLSGRGNPFDLHHPLPRYYDGWEFLVFLDIKEGVVSLYNPSQDLGVKLTWDLKRFPYLRSLYHSGRHGTTVGLEPGEDRFAGFEHSLKYGTFTTMNPGDVCDTWVAVEYKKSF